MKISPSKLIAIAASCVLVTGCTGVASRSDSGGDAHTIKWLIEEPEDPSAVKALTSEVATFTKATGIKVKISTLPSDVMRTVLQTQLRSGEGPDVFNWGSGPGFGGALAKAGLLYPLTDAYQKYNWKVFDFAKQRVTFDGKVYGVPGEMETIGIFYNKDMFKQLGLAEPKTIDDLRADSAAIKAAGKTPLAVGDKEGWEGGHLLSMALASEVGADRMLQIIDGKQSWDSAPVIQALNLWKGFEDDGMLPDSPTSVDYDTSTSMFYSGQAAMIPTGSWLVGDIDNNAKFDVGYIPFPGPDGPGIFSGGLGSGPFVSASSSDKEDAVKFVNFLASEEHGRWTVEHLHTIPPIPIDTTNLKVSPLFAQVLQDTAHLAEKGSFGQNIDVLTSDAVNQAMYDGVQGVLTGQMSAEQAAKGMAEAAKG